jgi:GNAT superfamily N-acetyltransferase
MIRFATAADLDGIEAIYDAILTREEAGPVYTNWQRGKYPTRSHAQQALDAGTLYVGEDNGFLWGVVNLNGIQLPEYDDIPWGISAEREQVGVIHTMCIHPAASGRGRARRMVTFCEEESRRLGKTVIRLDTWEGNLPANRMYPTLGYSFAGATEFFFQGFIHEILNCYEKAL